ncbi:substrate-binding domain-containing protein, partial [Paenibacillus sp. TAF58]
MVSDITNPFYPDLAKACEDLAQTKGFTINILNTDDKPDRTQLALNQVREGKVDGIIVTSALEQDREHFQKFMEQGYVLVLANRFIKGLQVDSVVADNFSGAIMATNHLYQLGHKKIAFMPGITGSSITEGRMNGYLKAMEDAGLSIYPEWLTSGGARYSGSYNTTKFLLGLP